MRLEPFFSLPYSDYPDSIRPQNIEPFCEPYPKKEMRSVDVEFELCLQMLKNS